MGQEISTSKFSRHDFYVFGQQLRRETELLAERFQQNKFCCDYNMGGFEVEAWLVDNNAMPSPINETFLKKLNNPYVVPELSSFNVELNVIPQVLEGRALKKLHDDLLMTWELCRKTARSLKADLMMIGIHPGIRQEELNLENMSSSPRYQALNEQVLALRSGRPLYLNINGRELYNTAHYDVMLEAATTSFQIHLQVRQDKAVRVYNAAQIASPALVAASANSPYVFGHDLWDESRIPVFEQSVDDGSKISKRVTYGKDYQHGSLMDCFEENLKKFSVLLPLNEERSLEEFSHVRLHNGTIWRWNRPLIGFEEDGRLHLRIENRVVPSGPTIEDMIANAAFFWGLVLTLSEASRPPEDDLPFQQSQENFYRAAYDSLESSLYWLDGNICPAKKLLLDELIPMAEDGLMQLEIDETDCRRYLGIIHNRVESGQNGAVWQRNWVARHGKDMRALSQAYLERQLAGKPVHEWDY